MAWNAIHRLVVITEQLVDVDGVFPDWVKIPDRFNPWYVSKSQQFVEDFLKNNLNLTCEKLKGFHAIVSSVNSLIFIQIEEHEYYNNLWEPNEAEFKYEINYKTTDGETHEERGQGLTKCIGSVHRIKMELDKTNGKGIIKIDHPTKSV